MGMEENSYFQDALRHMAHEAASGGAIRHLADMGYTVKQIVERLDFPTPYAQVQREVWERLTKEGVILLEEPGSSMKGGKASYVREYDRFGKATFRRVESAIEETRVTAWKERQEQAGEAGPLLCAAVEENGAHSSYASFDFGKMAKEMPEQYEAALSLLEAGQQEYIQGLPWERRMAYHRLDRRMLDVLLRLCRAGQYEGECYFLKTQEKVHLAAPK